MRIIIEFEEGKSDIEPEIRQEARTSETTPDEATDAGAAPRLEPNSTRETSEERSTSGEATTAGHAPEAMPVPTMGPPTIDETTTQAVEASPSGTTDAGRAPGRLQESPDEAPRPVDTDATDGGSAPDLGPNSAASIEGEAVDYEALVAGTTVDEIKERVRKGNFDIDRVVKAEQAGENRVTLIEWLENQDSGTGSSA